MSGSNPFSWNTGSVLSVLLAAASLALAAEPRFPTKPAATPRAKHVTVPEVALPQSQLQARDREVPVAAARKDDAALGTVFGQHSETCVACHSLYLR